MYLLDTNVLSSTSPNRTAVTPELDCWLTANEAVSYLSVVSILEISFGIERLRRKGATQKAARLCDWFHVVQFRFASRIIDCDREVSMLAGQLLVNAKMSGIEASTEDALIGATASVRGLRVVTFNLKDFRPMGVSCLDPETLTAPDRGPRL
jgi:hypothetical protein